MEIISGTTDDTFSAVPLPYGEFNCSGDNSPSLRMSGCRDIEVFLSLYSDKLELENRSNTVTFYPRINQMKYPVV